jgi:uncharacterized peroxidase-related enzyme
MSRIAIPASIDAAPEATRPTLEAVQKQLGTVPNLFRAIANSPAALAGTIALDGALARGRFDARTRERIAIAVAEENGCGYCLSAHTFIGKELLRVDDGELTAARDARSSDPKVDAALQFAVAVVRARGHVSDAVVAAVRAAGHDDAAIVELVALVAINTLTNYLNNVIETPIDFPSVLPRAA